MVRGRDTGGGIGEPPSLAAALLSNHFSKITFVAPPFRFQGPPFLRAPGPFHFKMSRNHGFYGFLKYAAASKALTNKCNPRNLKKVVQRKFDLQPLQLILIPMLLPLASMFSCHPSWVAGVTLRFMRSEFTSNRCSTCSRAPRRTNALHKGSWEQIGNSCSHINT